MLDTLKKLIVRDKDLPERACAIARLEAFRTGAIYDKLAFAFHQEREEMGTKAYIPLAKRKPAVRYGLPMIIVNDTTSLLFDDGHFPAVQVLIPEEGKDKPDTKTAEMYAAFVKETKLQAVFLEGAVMGSVGSVCFWFRLLNAKVYVKPLNTQYLTPFWQEQAPDVLERVEERRKVKGQELRDSGYTIADNDLARDFWFLRIWNAAAEEWYLPWPVLMTEEEKSSRKYPVMQIDEARTVKHALGFVPMVWCKNLPGGNDIDGVSTFEGGLTSSIEIDYQISQAGRGLKYSSDPTLVLMEAGIAIGDQAEPLVKSADRAIRLGQGDDARLLEISGAAQAAVENYVRLLREFALERCGGNRTSPEKLAGAQSGRAMEMMNQSLIWVASKLRTSYGEGALLAVLKMLLEANKVYPVTIAEKTYKAGELPVPASIKITLKWPPWYAPTATDHSAKATAIQVNRESGVMSQETGIAAIQHDFDIEDVDSEQNRINQERQEKAAQEIDVIKATSEAQAKAKPTLVKDAA